MPDSAISNLGIYTDVVGSAYAQFDAAEDVYFRLMILHPFLTLYANVGIHVATSAEIAHRNTWHSARQFRAISILATPFWNAGR